MRSCRVVPHLRSTQTGCPRLRICNGSPVVRLICFCCMTICRVAVRCCEVINCCLYYPVFQLRSSITVLRQIAVAVIVPVPCHWRLRIQGISVPGRSLFSAVYRQRYFRAAGMCTRRIIPLLRTAQSRRASLRIGDLIRFNIFIRIYSCSVFCN